MQTLIKLELYGLSDCSMLGFEQRIEGFKETPFSKVSAFQWICFLKTVKQVIPSARTVKNRQLLNIFYLDIITSYKG